MNKTIASKCFCRFFKKSLSVSYISWVTSASISLSELRSITVYILGEAYKPGAYTISGLSSVSNALFISGGVNENGSLRTIEVKRGGRTISNYDFYLLTDIDVPWERDSLRDRPDNREIMLSLFREVLESHNFPYKLISGSIETRIKSSVKVIDKLF